MNDDNYQMNKVINEQLVVPVRIEMGKTTILDGRDDSWWDTPEYWEEKESFFRNPISTIYGSPRLELCWSPGIFPDPLTILNNRMSSGIST